MGNKVDDDGDNVTGNKVNDDGDGATGNYNDNDGAPCTAKTRSCYLERPNILGPNIWSMTYYAKHPPYTDSYAKKLKSMHFSFPPKPRQ